ncbi:transglutaminase family protein [Sphingomonas sanguinis]|uniref:transglutaminase family protein n=1 Tax=Sphingomonas sp. LC-1 TaxID=3110957 RepID=UPI0021BAF43A|nr:transglutaminase family protein [Sphingomonas sp. LC-1]MCT8001667.1 transglutaminase family protein [Sphingomonas sp. LC-1]
MRIAVEHQLLCRPRSPLGTMVQMLRLTPENHDDQTVAHWRIDVDCDARLRRSHDGFGNAVTMLYIEDAPEVVTITAAGEVLTSDAHGLIHGAAETLPPPLFLRATQATPADPAIAGFAAEATRGAEGPLAALHALNHALRHRFAVDFEAKPAGPDLAHAFAQERATPCDLAHIFCVAARSLNIPARYVSGYAALNGAEQGKPHCWAEAHVPDLGWIGFDPCTGLSPQDRHVRVAVALDATGAAAVAGGPWAAVTATGETQ